MYIHVTEIQCVHYMYPESMYCKCSEQAKATRNTKTESDLRIEAITCLMSPPQVNDTSCQETPPLVKLGFLQERN